MLARIAGPSIGDVLGAVDLRAEDELEPRTEGDPLEEPVEHRRTLPRDRDRPARRQRSVVPSAALLSLTNSRPRRCSGAAQSRRMTIHPLAAPLSRPARPELTGGRRIGVLLSHGFTGPPASMHAVGPSTSASSGYAVEVPRLPGHGTSWQELNTTALGRLVRRDHRASSRSSAVRPRRRRRRRPVDGRRAGAAAGRRPRRTGSPAWWWSTPRCATKRLDVKLLPVLKHVVPSFPGIANDIKKPGGDEHGYTRTPLKAIHSLMQAWPPLIADLPKITAPLLYFRSTEDHVVDGSSQPIITSRVSSTRDHRAAARRELPRRHARQRRRADLRGVRRVHRPGDRVAVDSHGAARRRRRLAGDRRQLRRPGRGRARPAGVRRGR